MLLANSFTTRLGSHLCDICSLRAGGDRLWNYHVWTVVDVSRPDLKLDQVTPNIIDGTWNAGPVSIQRFKERKLDPTLKDVPYDTNVYDASVNSPVVFTYRGADGKDQFTWEKPFIPANSIVTKKDDSVAGCRTTLDPKTGRYTGVCIVETVQDYKLADPNPVPNPPGGPARFMAVQQDGAQGAAAGADEDDGRDSKLQHAGTADFTIESSIPVSVRVGNDFATTMKLNKRADKLQISLWAMTYDNRPVFKLTDASVSNTDTLQLKTTEAQWNRDSREDRLKLAEVTHIMALYEATQGGKVVVTDFRLMSVKMPKINMLCGKKQVCVGFCVLHCA